MLRSVDSLLGGRLRRTDPPHLRPELLGCTRLAWSHGCRPDSGPRLLCCRSRWLLDVNASSVTGPGSDRCHGGQVPGVRRSHDNGDRARHLVHYRRPRVPALPRATGRSQPHRCNAAREPPDRDCDGRRPAHLGRGRGVEVVQRPSIRPVHARRKSTSKSSSSVVRAGRTAGTESPIEGVHSARARTSAVKEVVHEPRSGRAPVRGATVCFWRMESANPVDGGDRGDT